MVEHHSPIIFFTDVDYDVIISVLVDCLIAENQFSRLRQVFFFVTDFDVELAYKC